jgi:hypothetical protein
MTLYSLTQLGLKLSVRRLGFDPRPICVGLMGEGEISGIQKDYTPRTSVSLCQYHFTNAPYSRFIHLSPTPCKMNNFSIVKSKTSLFCMEKSPSREANNALVEKFPAFYGT